MQSHTDTTMAAGDANPFVCRPTKKKKQRKNYIPTQHTRATQTFETNPPASTLNFTFDPSAAAGVCSPAAAASPAQGGRGRGRGAPATAASPPAATIPPLPPLEPQPGDSAAMGEDEDDAMQGESDMWVCPKCHSLASHLVTTCAGCGTSKTLAQSVANLDDAYADLPTELADLSARRKGAKGGAAGGKGGKGVAQAGAPAASIGRVKPGTGAGKAGAAAAAGAAGGKGARGGTVSTASGHKEWVAAGYTAPPVDHEKEAKVAAYRMKEMELQEMKEKLAERLKQKKLDGQVTETAESGQLRVDHPNGDGCVYTQSEYLAYYTGTKGKERWVACPTLGQWGIWGFEKPSNADVDEFINLSLAEATKQVKVFQEKKVARDEEKRKRLEEDPLVQAAIAKAKQEAAEKEKQEKDAMMAELMELRAAKAAAEAAKAGVST